MSSVPRAPEDRNRKTIEDVVVFGVASAGAVYTTLAMGPVGLGVACVLLSVAAAIVVGRENGVHEPADRPTGDGPAVADGGRED